MSFQPTTAGALSPTPPLSARAPPAASSRPQPRPALQEQRHSHANHAAGSSTIRIVTEDISRLNQSRIPPSFAPGSWQDGLVSPLSASAGPARRAAESQGGSFVQRMAARYEVIGSNTSPQSRPRQPQASYRGPSPTATSGANTVNTPVAPSSPSNCRPSRGTISSSSPLPSSSGLRHDSYNTPSLPQEERPSATPTVRVVIPSLSTASDTSFSSPTHEVLKLSQEDLQDTSETSYDHSGSSTSTLIFYNKNRQASLDSVNSRHTPAGHPSTSQKTFDDSQSLWPRHLEPTPNHRPPSHDSNYIRHVDSDSDELAHLPTRGPDSIGSFSSNRTVYRRPPRANLREDSGLSSGSDEQFDCPRSSIATSREPISVEDITVAHDPNRDWYADEEWSQSRMPPLSQSSSRVPESSSPSTQYKWSPPLSTIESVSKPRTGSMANTVALGGLARSSKSQTVTSLGPFDARISPGQLDTEETFSPPPELPNPGSSALSRATRATSQIGSPHAEEGTDTVGELHPQPLRLQRSGLFRRGSDDNTANDGRPDTAASDRSSYTSPFANSIPQWARLYYRLSDRISLPTESSYSPANSPRPSRSATMHSGNSRSPAEADFPIHPIWSPRRRPRQEARSGFNSKSDSSLDQNRRLGVSQESISHVPTYPKTTHATDYDVGRSRANTGGSRSMARPTTAGREYSTPRLRCNSGSVTLSMWTAPSLDHSLGSPANKYILFFALGFVMPLCWIVAAFLPLPMRPNIELELLESEKEPKSDRWKGKRRTWPLTEAQPTAPGDEFKRRFDVDMEAGPGLDLRNKTQKHQRDWALEERLWHKARWWRRVNQIMSMIGLGIIGAVIAVAVVDTR